MLLIRRVLSFKGVASIFPSIFIVIKSENTNNNTVFVSKLVYWLKLVSNMLQTWITAKSSENANRQGSNREKRCRNRFITSPRIAIVLRTES